MPEPVSLFVKSSVLFAITFAMGCGVSSPDPPREGTFVIGLKLELPDDVADRILGGGMGETLEGAVGLDVTVTQLQVVHRTDPDDPSTEQVITVRDEVGTLRLVDAFDREDARQLVFVNIPEGFVSQIRFIVSDMTLEFEDGSIKTVTLPSGSQTGLKVDPGDGEPFEIVAEERTGALILFNPFTQMLRNRGQGLKLKPHLFADHIDPDALRPTSLSRLVVRYKTILDFSLLPPFIVRVPCPTHAVHLAVEPIGHVVDADLSTNYFIIELDFDVSPSEGVRHLFGTRPFFKIDEDDIEFTHCERDFVALDFPVVPRAVNDPPCDTGFFQNSDAWEGTGAPEAWDTTTGRELEATGQGTFDDTGREVAVALVDTGVELEHPDLRGHWYINQGELPVTQIRDDLVIVSFDIDGDDVITQLDIDAIEDLIYLDAAGNADPTHPEHDGVITFADLNNTAINNVVCTGPFASTKCLDVASRDDLNTPDGEVTPADLVSGSRNYKNIIPTGDDVNVGNCTESQFSCLLPLPREDDPAPFPQPVFCVSKALTCNGKSDCGDGSDEAPLNQDCAVTRGCRPLDLSTHGMEDNFDGDGNGFCDDLLGWDFEDEDNRPEHNPRFDDGTVDPLIFGHGTAMASVIGAQGSNNRQICGALSPADEASDTHGVMWGGIRLLPVRHKITERSADGIVQIAAQRSDIYIATRYVYGTSGLLGGFSDVRVINLSLGSTLFRDESTCSVGTPGVIEKVDELTQLDFDGDGTTGSKWDELNVVLQREGKCLSSRVDLSDCENADQKILVIAASNCQGLDLDDPNTDADILAWPEEINFSRTVGGVDPSIVVSSINPFAFINDAPFPEDLVNSTGATDVDIVAPTFPFLSLPSGVLGDRRSFPLFPGTSPAAAFVSGAVGLTIATDPTLSVSAIKQRILNGASQHDALRPFIAEGRVINVHKAVQP